MSTCKIKRERERGDDDNDDDDDDDEWGIPWHKHQVASKDIILEYLSSSQIICQFDTAK